MSGFLILLTHTHEAKTPPKWRRLALRVRVRSTICCSFPTQEGELDHAFIRRTDELLRRSPGHLGRPGQDLNGRNSFLWQRGDDRSPNLRIRARRVDYGKCGTCVRTRRPPPLLWAYRPLRLRPQAFSSASSRPTTTSSLRISWSAKSLWNLPNCTRAA